VSGGSPPPRRGGLFLRIYVTFILTVVAFAAIVGVVVLSLAGQYDAAWVESVDAAVAAREPALSRLLADIDDPASRAALAARSRPRREGGAAGRVIDIGEQAAQRWLTRGDGGVDRLDPRGVVLAGEAQHDDADDRGEGDHREDEGDVDAEEQAATTWWW
jgi:hypothetical protein